MADLAARLAMYRDDLHAALAVGSEAVPDWTPVERRRLAGCPPRVVELVETAKAVITPLGGVEVVAVVDEAEAHPAGHGPACFREAE